MTGISVSVVVVTYARQPLLVDCVESILGSTGVEPEVILVDNGHVGEEVLTLEACERVKVVRPGANLGFAGGCNLGVQHASTDFVILINPDVIVSPTALEQLVGPVHSDDASVTTATVVMLKEPHIVNSAGNRMHPCGVSWCGSFRDDLSNIGPSRNVLLASGAAMACSRAWWDELGGLQEVFFAYYEDTEFSLNTVLRGGSIRLVRDAVVMHDYDFGRNPSKMFLLDRNRMMMVLALYRWRTLVVLLPILLLHEVAISVFAIAGGWGRQRLSALKWMIRNRRTLKQVRRRLQDKRTIEDGVLLRSMEIELVPENLELPRLVRVLQMPLQMVMVGTRWLILRIEKTGVR